MTEVVEHVASPLSGRAARVLYLTHRVPYPPDKGDRILNFHLLRQLARRAEVWLGCLADEPVTPEMMAKLDAVKWEMLEEWSQTRRAPKHAAWMHAPAEA